MCDELPPQVPLLSVLPVGVKKGIGAGGNAASREKETKKKNEKITSESAKRQFRTTIEVENSSAPNRCTVWKYIKRWDAL